jgi:hypothetical protein
LANAGFGDFKDLGDFGNPQAFEIIHSQDLTMFFGIASIFSAKSETNSRRANSSELSCAFSSAMTSCRLWCSSSLPGMVASSETSEIGRVRRTMRVY